MAVDLLSTRLLLASEASGDYAFRDADAHRRDRRKDMVLQLNPYLVARCLADDVVADLGRVLATLPARSQSSAPCHP